MNEADLDEIVGRRRSQQEEAVDEVRVDHTSKLGSNSRCTRRGSNRKIPWPNGYISEKSRLVRQPTLPMPNFVSMHLANVPGPGFQKI